MKTAIIILAAGNSLRLGHPKQLVKHGDTTLLNLTIQAASHSDADQVLVVLGHHDEEIANSISKEVPVVINPNWEKGMGNSLKFGLQQAQHLFGELNAVMISVCDQPFLSADVFNALMDQAVEAPLVASHYENNIIGVPVLFMSNLFADMQSIADDQGAKAIVKMHQNDLKTILFHKGNIDIDTAEDIEKIKRGGD